MFFTGEWEEVEEVAAVVVFGRVAGPPRTTVADGGGPDECNSGSSGYFGLFRAVVGHDTEVQFSGSSGYLGFFGLFRAVVDLGLIL
ncbi:hypothetical protein HanXRQr2_Chr06g0255291 [Helianthus annuus]|uniref:Uncharacterized protein n=1 Tax=Helianthus annuus TaxID=4232 RepID=A0A9K3ISR5_HELAN|nr:hypothetical protein HanXRQr2_Chr06g0255291 [Helianthus annuus]KAJ0560262.1 hypothetical protein HanHA300_Chr06g0209511 [Helianthus annuus]KAJ0566526.1 hypothetical protein HanIR_Chr06g0274711 [Helianthus annuus]KAJ0573272.1 hypothetical protein HanHA89_Chr06g0224921 [Helianthus annuus]KAJ0915128.1 hypothetical protein HanPSC8_Chr06g0246401 [Helianthus annuus]